MAFGHLVSTTQTGVSCHGNAEDIRHVQEVHPCARLGAQDVPQQLKSKRELRELADHLGVQVKNPTRTTGTRWTPHLERVVAILLKGLTSLTTPGLLCQN